MDEVKEECAHYARIVIGRIFVFDPVARKGYEWQGSQLEPIEQIKFDNGAPRLKVRLFAAAKLDKKANVSFFSGRPRPQT